MVVIKADLNFISDCYGDDFLQLAEKFSSVMGYSIEHDSGELKLEFNPDRPDLFSFTTLNSAIRAYYKNEIIKPISPVRDDLRFQIFPEALKLRSQVSAFVAVGQPVGNKFRDLIEFQEKIHQSIGKNRSKVSIGLHDMRLLKPPFRYQSFKASEISFIPYDQDREMKASEILRVHSKGQEFSHLLGNGLNVPIIMDSENQVLSMPPIVNGKASIVSGSTEKFFVDITGTDRGAVEKSCLLLQHFFASAGYEIRIPSLNGGISPAEISKMDSRSIRVNLANARKILGLSRINPGTVKEDLIRMGYYSADPRLSGEDSLIIDVRVPGYRVDVMGEIDIIEDLGKSIGYDHIEERRPVLDLIGAPRFDTVLKDRIREISVGLGLQEVMTFVVTSGEYYQFTVRENGINIYNPKSQDFSVVRDRLRLNILDFLRINKRRSLPQRVFEIGDVIKNLEQQTVVCYAITGYRAGFSEIKQYLNALLQRFNKDEPKFDQAEISEFIPGRSGYIIVGGRQVGVIGEVHPETLTRFDLTSPVALFELNMKVFVQ